MRFLSISIAIVLLLSIPLCVNAQKRIEDYEGYGDLTPEQQEQVKTNIQNKMYSLQVKSIAGVEFGSSREKVEKMMTKKYGSPMFASSQNDLIFENIKYAGYDFDSVHFLFQSDGVNIYLNCCIFVIEARDYSEALDKESKLADILKTKYEDLQSGVDHNGNPMHSGGISPLWNGDINNLADHVGALHTSILKYDEEKAKIAGRKPYAVRLIYGPYNYVNEEF